MKKHLLSALPFAGAILAIGTFISLAAATPTQAMALSYCRNVELAAHRGATTSYATENTIRSFVHATALGARTLETDVHLTKDHRWVLMHDDTVNRTTRGSAGYVRNLTYAQVHSLTTNDGVKGGVPSLYAFADYLKDRPSLKAQIEIKDYAASYDDIRSLMTVLGDRGLKDRVMIISFALTPIARVKVLDSTWTTGWLTSGQASATYITRYSIDYALTNQRYITPSYVTNMRSAGARGVGAWTTDDYTNWKKVVTAGVSSITTDRVSTLHNYCY